ncbi:MAG: MarR family transcriptional regulator [Actinomycetia bacterium]|nr:MarR family transcriptional regulator [Actinomycetes bacterium]
MDTGRQTELAEEFFSSIRKMLWGIRVIFREEMEKHGVTWPQFHLLSAVRERRRATIGELSRYLMVTAPTASRMIDSLYAKGLLQKESDPADHRVTRLMLTGRSEKLLEDVAVFRDRAVAGILEGESDEELERTMSHLAELSDRWFQVAGETARKGCDEEHCQCERPG